jgi:hypothetical protein
MTSYSWASRKHLARVFNQALELEAVDIADRMSSRFRQALARIFWRSQSPPNRMKRLPTANMLVLWELLPLSVGLPHNSDEEDE